MLFLTGLLAAAAILNIDKLTYACNVHNLKQVCMRATVRMQHRRQLPTIECVLFMTPTVCPRSPQIAQQCWALLGARCESSNFQGEAPAYLIGRNFVGNQPSTLILGDNIFYGQGLDQVLVTADQRPTGATVFVDHVHDPDRYGVVEFGPGMQVVSIEEKPAMPKSGYAVTGLYFYDDRVCDIAAEIKPSARGQLEITDINRFYLESGQLTVQTLGRGLAWLDAGTHEPLLDAAQFIATIKTRQGLTVAVPEEIAFRQGYISDEQLERLAKPLNHNDYGKYLMQVLHDHCF